MHSQAPIIFLSSKNATFPVRKMLSVPFLLVSSLLLASAVAEEVSPESAPRQISVTEIQDGYETTFPAMGSTMSIIAYAPNESQATKAFEEAQQEVERLNSIMTDYESDSELNLFVKSSPTPTPLSKDLWNVLVASQSWYQRTDGAFDASIGALTRMWRAARRAKSEPSSDQIARAVSLCGWQHISLDNKTHAGTIDKQEVKIDLGGIAAGYIIDATFDIMIKHGLSKCLINAGGDIRCGDSPPGRIGWRIEIAPLADMPKSETSAGNENNQKLPLRRIHLSNASIVTSGDLWQFYEFNGIRRSHILDPKTGIGVPGPTVVAVIASKCIDADAAATAISVMGIKEGMLFASLQSDIQAMMVTRDRRTNELQYRVTDDFPTGIYDPN
ncbi:MAG: FAD:protein FMN transferase [Planctomycetota bacterium]|nr:FAD:protein FMN transferase [Planctomycetota bacterium]